MDLSETPVADLKPYKQNARTHSPEQVRQIVKSIEQFGFTNPVLTDGKNRIVAGHGRVMAAKEMGLPTVPTIPLGHLTKAQVRAYVIADNKLALNAGWDEQLLAEELKGIDDSEIDIDLTGFSEDEIAELLKEEPTGSSEEGDNVPDTPENIFNVQRGQIWQLGDHRLMCGDSTDKGDVDRLMDGQKADMVFTDPPYNTNFDGKYNEVYTATKGVNTIDETKEWDKDFDVTITLDVVMDHTKPTTNYFIFPGWYPFWRKVFPFFHDRGEDWAAKPFIWCKKFAVSNVRQTSTANATEPCLMAYRKGHDFQAKPGTENYDYILLASNEGGRSYDHPTSKPVALCEHLITFSLDKSLVLDPFLGSGSTLIACEKTGRRCFGMEIDPHYCSVIINRWQEYTGKTAEPVDGS